uniref:Uncharacterized protein n=1 Tax=Kryptolebias marmoratus TaxID=37003 RepID=A0A3Q3BD20_KRYMA
MDPHLLDLQRDANRQISELKFKLVKSEQEVTALEQNVVRLEAQVSRYKSAFENAEKIEDELKVERRRLQREVRDPPLSLRLEMNCQKDVNIMNQSVRWTDGCIVSHNFHFSNLRLHSFQSR